MSLAGKMEAYRELGARVAGRLTRVGVLVDVRMVGKTTAERRRTSGLPERLANGIWVVGLAGASGAYECALMTIVPEGPGEFRGTREILEELAGRLEEQARALEGSAQELAREEGPEAVDAMRGAVAQLRAEAGVVRVSLLVALATWRDAEVVQPGDANPVLGFFPDNVWDVWPCYFEDGEWKGCDAARDGMTLEGSAAPTRWRTMPAGPVDGRAS